jgi:malonate transporter
MYEIFMKTLPFFALIGVGFWAGKSRFFTEEATAYLTKFVFYFALSAMLFRFSSNLSLADLLKWDFVFAYLGATVSIYLLATCVSLWRKKPLAEAAIEAQCAVIGNVGFLGIPMLALLMGEGAVGHVMMVLAVDLLVFGSIVVMVIVGSRDGRMHIGILRTLALGLVKNPMIVSIIIGLVWAAWEIPIPAPLNEFMSMLGSAATPGALFAIGASLASKSAERIETAAWLSFCKLILHPLAVSYFALVVFPVDPYAAAVMIAASALPVAGNIYMIAEHYNVAPQRVSASILISTAVSIFTVSLVIAWVTPLYQ